MVCRTTRRAVRYRLEATQFLDQVAGRLGGVEGEEMDAGGASFQQLAALTERECVSLLCRILRMSRIKQIGGIEQPERLVNFSICFADVNGITPGINGMEMPTACAFSTNEKYRALSKNSCETA